MKKFKKLIPAFCMLLVSAILLGSSTYAWFSMNDTVKATGMQINAIAAAVGYQDQLAFSKIFKQHFGTSPKAYREMGEELQLVSEKGKYTSKKM